MKRLQRFARVFSTIGEQPADGSRDLEIANGDWLRDGCGTWLHRCIHQDLTDVSIKIRSSPTNVYVIEFGLQCGRKCALTRRSESFSCRFVIICADVRRPGFALRRYLRPLPMMMTSP